MPEIKGSLVEMGGKIYLMSLGVYFDRETGEMCVEGDRYDEVKPSGYTFERVFQKLDDLEWELFPLAFATRETAEKVVKKLQGFFGGVVFYVAESDFEMGQFPTYRPDGTIVRQLFLTSPDMQGKYNVGLIASTLMRNPDSVAKLRLKEEFGLA